MSIFAKDPLTQLAFSVYENPGVFAVLLGSGLSRSAEIPTGWEITLDLIRRVALAQGVEQQADWAEVVQGDDRARAKLFDTARRACLVTG